MGSYARFLRRGMPWKGRGCKLGLERMRLAMGRHGGLCNASASLSVPFSTKPPAAQAQASTPALLQPVCCLLKCVNCLHKIASQSCHGCVSHPGPVNKGLPNGGENGPAHRMARRPRAWVCEGPSCPQRTPGWGLLCMGMALVGRRKRMRHCEAPQ